MKSKSKVTMLVVAVAAVECKCAGFQNRQMRRQHHTLDYIVKI